VTDYERCSGKHRGGDSCVSERGHLGACTFGAGAEIKRAPVRGVSTHRDAYSGRTPTESAAAAEQWVARLPAKYLGTPLTQEPVTLLLELAEAVRVLATELRDKEPVLAHRHYMS
jgi:hypothetical protein